MGILISGLSSTKVPSFLTWDCLALRHSINPRTVMQGQYYTITVSAGSNMTLDVQYCLVGGPTQTLTGWPMLDSNGLAENICTSSRTPVAATGIIRMHAASCSDGV